MTNNSNLPLGYDLYEGNDMYSFEKLKGPEYPGPARFIYLRVAIGSHIDIKFIEFFHEARAAGLLIGPYIELWPGMGADAHMRTIQNALAKLGPGNVFDLPMGLVYEQQPIRGKKKKYVMTWPEPGMLASLYNKFSPGSVMIYAGLAGLDQLHSYLKLSQYNYWIARYNLHQGRDGEIDIDDTLHVLSHYGIDRARVLFMQTADGLPYPKGASPDLDADYDRVISYVLPGTPEPLPEPIPNVPPIDPEPIPPSVPTTNLYRIKRTAKKNAPTAAVNKPGNDVHSLMTSELQWLWYGNLFRAAPVSFNEERIKQAWRGLTGSSVAFTPQGTDVKRDYISGRNLQASDPHLGCYPTDDNLVNVLDDKPRMIGGRAYLKIETIDPKHIPGIDQCNRILTPWLVHIATIIEPDLSLRNFPQLEGNEVPYLLCSPDGYNFLLVENLEKVK